MDIYQILKQEHELVADLLEQLQAGRGDRVELFRMLVTELMSHALAEELVVYSMLQDEQNIGDMILDAWDEHHLVESLLGEAQEALADDELFLQKIELIQTMVLEHVEKEEGILLPQAEQMLDDVVAEGLAGEFLAEKDEVIKSLESQRGIAGRLLEAVR